MSVLAYLFTYVCQLLGKNFFRFNAPASVQYPCVQQIDQSGNSSGQRLRNMLDEVGDRQ